MKTQENYITIEDNLFIKVGSSSWQSCILLLPTAAFSIRLPRWILFLVRSY